jgi:fructose-specific phosphotransferase system component IIB
LIGVTSTFAAFVELECGAPFEYDTDHIVGTIGIRLAVMTLDSDVTKFNALVTAFNAELEAFRSGKKVASTRARKAIGEAAKLAKEIRKGIQDEKDSK